MTRSEATYPLGFLAQLAMRGPLEEVAPIRIRNALSWQSLDSSYSSSARISAMSRSFLTYHSVPRNIIRAPSAVNG